MRADVAKITRQCIVCSRMLITTARDSQQVLARSCALISHALLALDVDHVFFCMMMAVEVLLRESTV
jgi:hypothetical protein